MAPETPKYKKQEPTSEDKFEAAMMAAAITILSIVGLVLFFGLLSVLWQVGIINAIIIIGIFLGLFAIGRALYHTLLEKDFS